jgi:hypothetical protein
MRSCVSLIGVLLALAATFSVTHATSSCTCYCTGAGGITQGVPFPQVGNSFAVADTCYSCVWGACTTGFPTQCTGCPTCGTEARCSNIAANQCKDPLVSSSVYSRGWSYSSSSQLPWAAGSMAMLKCMAGTDARTSTPVPPSYIAAVFSATCVNSQWQPTPDSPGSITASCSPCDANTYNPADSFERLACKLYVLLNFYAAHRDARVLLLGVRRARTVPVVQPTASVMISSPFAKRASYAVRCSC